MFRFTIREMLLTTFVVALGAGWYVDRTMLSRSYAAHLREVANRFRNASNDATDFADFGIANGKLLWKEDPELYKRMADHLNVMDQLNAELDNRRNFPENRDLVRPPND